MKKSNKLISILLAMVMMLTIAPLTAFAATEAYQLNRDDYLECAYSENVTQYYRDNNYLYKATYSNFKNVAKVGICFDYSYYLRLHYISSDGEKSGYASLYKSIKEVAKAGDLPKSPGATLSCLSDNEELYINKDKPVVTFTCLAVNAPVWTWNGTSSATAKFTSTDGKATMTAVNTQSDIKIFTQLIPQFCRNKQTVLIVQFCRVFSDQSPRLLSILLHFSTTLLHLMTV